MMKYLGLADSTFWLKLPPLSLCNSIHIILTTTNHMYCNCLFHFNFKFYIKLTLKQPVVFMFHPQKLSFGCVVTGFVSVLVKFSSRDSETQGRTTVLRPIKSSPMRPWSDQLRVWSKENIEYWKQSKILENNLPSPYMVRWGGVGRVLEISI